MATPLVAPVLRRRPVASGSRRDAVLAGLLLVGFTAAVVLRCAVGGASVARSRPAGLVFAAALLLLMAVARPHRGSMLPEGHRLRAGLLWGVAGAAVLCIPAVASGLDVGFARATSTGFLGWAAVVTVVAGAEEAFLRGTLYRLLAPYGSLVAIGVPALAFAALHVPLYGWGAAPLDLAVGVWLGALRVTSGTLVAPAAAHVLADWAAWWLLVQG